MQICRYSLINSLLSPIIKPKYVKIVHHIKAPAVVYSEKIARFMRAIPAGNDIYCLIRGINLPINVEI